MTVQERHLYVEPPWFLDLGPAACSSGDPERFFVEAPSGPGQRTNAAITAAKAICSGCELRDPCLTYALANDQQGIWGGTTNADRRRMRQGAA